METTYQIITIDQIPQDILFEGYYWYSDCKFPEIILQDPIQQKWFTDMPFVVEANFYARKEQMSIQVRAVDGFYQIAQIDLNQLGHLEYSTKKYIGHDLKKYVGHDLKRYDFEMIEAWIPTEPDDLLEGMQTLTPAWTAFAGFITKQ